MAKIIFDIHWKELSDFTIQQAALLTMGVDPDDYAVTMLGDPELATVPFEYTVEWNDILEQKTSALTSGIRSGQLEVIEKHHDQYGRLDPVKTSISRAGLVAWWRQHGYIDVLTEIAPQSGYERKALSETGDVSLATAPTVPTVMQEYFSHAPEDALKLHYQKLASQERGCRMMILENWVKIQKEYGAQVIGRQVHGFIRRITDPADKVPQVKTVQNELKKLRNEGKIPHS